MWFMVTVALVCVLSAGFYASADNGDVTVSLQCSGPGRIYQGTQMVARTTGSIDAAKGTSVSLTAVPDSDGVFLYWVNMETNRIFSFNETFTFAAATYLKVEAVFCSDDSDVHYVTHLTVNDNILRGIEVFVGDPLLHVDYTPARDGYTWTGEWTYTEQEVKESGDDLLVYPVFTKNESELVVRILLDGGVQSSAVYEFLDLVELSADVTHEGQPFSYWAVINEDESLEIVSYYADYLFYVTKDVDLTPVYGDDSGSGIVTRITGARPNLDEDRVTVYAERSVSMDFEVLQHGMLLTLDDQTGSRDDLFVIDENNPLIEKRTGNGTEHTGTYGVTYYNWKVLTNVNGVDMYIYPRLYARSYVVVKDSGGATHTIYGTVYVVEEQYGGMPGDDIDDPWG